MKCDIQQDVNVEGSEKEDLLHVGFLQERLFDGGAEMVSLRSADFFDKRGVTSTFFVSEVDKAEKNRLPCGEIITLPHDVMSYDCFSDENVALLSDEINRRDIRILFINAETKYVVVPAMLRQQTPRCHYVYWQHLPPMWEIINKVAGKAARARMSVGRWIEVNLLWRPKYLFQRGRAIKQLREVYLRCFRSVNGLIVLHECYRQEWIRLFALDSEEQSRIYSFINTLPINGEAKIEKKKQIVFVGRLSLADKQVDLLLNLWRRVAPRLPDWELRFHGTGRVENMLQNRIDKYCIPRVKLMGYTANTQKVYDDAAVLCLPSSYEGWPLAIEEAQNNGVVPVAFNCCQGVAAMIGEGEHAAGICVEKNNWAMFGNELVRLCQDEDLRARMQQNCMEKRWEYAPGVNDATWKTMLGRFNLRWPTLSSEK
ncbi:glycosyltransferase [Prevotella sp. A2931]|uniref:Glycosyltransferase n=1 Tax=Prevotella illustrans TaxID=2800387 RepID=A0ABS3M3N5_9BACT|nr:MULTISPECIES: glycosyltransferase [Prevotella]MBO1362784.1 glycosyltransferase [Prevotella illustrans]PTL25777.1 hypothetical protein C3V39_01000 [Prevotella sp. oral taxon 820]